MKIELKIPMLSLGDGAKPSKKPKDMKDVDEGAPKEKAKRKELDKMQSAPVYKPPTKAKLHKDAVHDEVRSSTREWVAGRKSTKEHQKTVERAKMALKMPTSVGMGVRQSKDDFTGGKAD
jgi:hypothetical protein